MARILVVEDSRTQAVIFQFLLKQAGYDVEVAANGLEALAAIERTPPDVVLTDLQMPEMDGVELVKALRPRKPAIPVVLMTGEGSETLAEQALEAGAVAAASKQEPEKDCLKQVQTVLKLTAARQSTGGCTGCVVEAELKFEIAKPHDIPEVVGHVLRELAAFHVTHETDELRTGMALAKFLEDADGRGQLHASLNRSEAKITVSTSGNELEITLRTAQS